MTHISPDDVLSALRMRLRIRVFESLRDDGPNRLERFYRLAKEEFPSLCDDQNPCTCGTEEPRWQHSVRWVLEDLRSRGHAFNSANGRPWTYVDHSVIVMDRVRIDVREGLQFQVKKSGKVGLHVETQNKIVWLDEGDLLELGNARPREAFRPPSPLPSVSYLARVLRSDGYGPEGWVSKKQLMASTVRWMGLPKRDTALTSSPKVGEPRSLPGYVKVIRRPQ